MSTKNNINISILIPCYNWDILELASSLQQLCAQEKGLNKFEILCFEDGSVNFFQNHKIKNIQNVKYKILKKNIGRSKIRNLMASKSLYNWLLFIDADHKVTNKQFVSSYIDQIKKHTQQDSNNKKIYYGSTIYPKGENKKTKKLHWHYGQKIESRRKQEVFSSHHFLIPKAYFQNGIKFNTKIKSYGYEDVFFVLENNLTAVYIKNPLLHIGIKTNEQFIRQTQSALKNLNACYHLVKKPEKTIKILYAHKLISKFKLTRIITMVFQLLKQPIIKNLNSNYPLIWLFQFYKLAYFISIKNKNSLLKKGE